jgi:hypothetical protein
VILAFNPCGPGGCFGADIPPIPYGKAVCPVGYYQDPETGACIFIGKPGIATKIPIWGYALIGAGCGLILARLTGERW